MIPRTTMMATYGNDHYGDNDDGFDKLRCDGGGDNDNDGYGITTTIVLMKIPLMI